MNEEELYQEYRIYMQRAEDDREMLARKMRTLGEMREMSKLEQTEDQYQIEEIIRDWGECEETGAVINQYEEMAEELEKEFQQKEEALREEQKQLQKECAEKETWYEAEKRRLANEEEKAWET